MLELQSVIETYVHLRPISPLGWRRTICAVCHDHGRKGPRGGFNFQPDRITYNCFNCGHSAAYDATNITISKDMLTTLDSFGVPSSEYNKAAFLDLRDVGGHSTNDKRSTVTSSLQVIPVPTSFYELSDDREDEVAQLAIDWLATEKAIDWKQYKLYLADRTNPKWFARVILPSYRNKELIFYQGRDLIDTRASKYISVNVPRTHVLHGYDRLHVNTHSPLYITEGWFDAEHVEGVAALGRTLSPEVVKILDASPRPKVIIPDKSGRGYDLALQGIRNGWGVAFPDINECKDVTEAVVEYGKMYTLMSIKNNIYTDAMEASIKLRVYCSK